MTETLLNLFLAPRGHDCHVMFGAAAAGHLDEPRKSFLGFSVTACTPTDWVCRGLGVTVILSLLQRH